MKEIEVKILDVDPEKIGKELLKIGAHKEAEGEVITEFWDFPDKRLKDENKILRIRSYDSRFVLTFKEQLSKDGAKVATEHESELSSKDSTDEILLGIGMQKRRVSKKHRTTYEWKGIEIVIDKYHHNTLEIPPLMEIEAKSEEEIYALIEMLGFKKSESKPWTTKDVIKHYKNLESP